jgi:hypothetical protein
VPDFTPEEFEEWLDGYSVATKLAIKEGRERDLWRLLEYKREFGGRLNFHPLRFAIEHGRLSATKEILRSSMCMTRSPGFGYTVLCLICKMRREERAIRFLKSMDRFNLRYNNGFVWDMPPVMHALRRSHWHLAERMFERMSLEYQETHPMSEIEDWFAQEHAVREHVRARVRDGRRGRVWFLHKHEDEMVRLVLESGDEGLKRAAFTVGGLPTPVGFPGLSNLPMRDTQSRFDHEDDDGEPPGGPWERFLARCAKDRRREEIELLGYPIRKWNLNTFNGHRSGYSTLPLAVLTHACYDFVVSGQGFDAEEEAEAEMENMAADEAADAFQAMAEEGEEEGGEGEEEEEEEDGGGWGADEGSFGLHEGFQEEDAPED